MGFEELQLWIKNADMVRRAARRGQPATAHLRSMLVSEVEKLSVNVGDYPAWTDAVRDALMDHYAIWVAREKGYPLLTRRSALSLKCARMGYALAGGDLSALLPSEVGFLAGKGLLDAEPPAPGTVPVPDGSTYAVEFLTSFSQVKPGAVRATHPAIAKGTAFVTRVPERDTRVAWRLSMGEGAPTLDVLDHEGALYRPVLAPGRADPVTEGEFSHACASGDAWADDPFNPHRENPVLALVEYAKPATPLRRKDADRMGHDVSRALQCAGRLISVGGVIYRETGEPTVHVVLDHSDDEHSRVARLAWQVVGLRMGDPQAIMAPSLPYDFRFESLGHERLDKALSFPASRPDVAVDVGTAIAEHSTRCRVRFDPTVPYEPTGPVGGDALTAIMGALRAAAAHEGVRRPDFEHILNLCDRPLGPACDRPLGPARTSALKSAIGERAGKSSVPFMSVLRLLPKALGGGYPEAFYAGDREIDLDDEARLSALAP